MKIALKIGSNFIFFMCCYFLAISFFVAMLNNPLGWMTLLRLLETIFFLVIGAFFHSRFLDSVLLISYDQLNKFLTGNDLHEEYFQLKHDASYDDGSSKLVSVTYNGHDYPAEVRHYFRITSIHEGYFFFINEGDVEKTILVVYDTKKYQWATYTK